ncbi:MAG: hypothetical protein HY519_03745, partial [Candidatus Aenigmarchaeota archaeon]|nr:hypothetical protein [Candidatus Aenigmarchaeota archaeon]
LAEKIGDLRRMLLDSEKETKAMQLEFEKTKEIVSMVEPVRLRKDLDGLAARLQKSDMRLETLEQHRKKDRDDVQKLLAVFAKVRGIETMVEALQDIDAKLEKAARSTADAERFSAKAESAYFEFSRGMSEMKTKLDTVSRLDEMAKEMVKEIDKIGLLVKAGQGDGMKDKIAKLFSGKTGPMESAFGAVQQVASLELKVRKLEEAGMRMAEELEAMHKAAAAPGAAADAGRLKSVESQLQSLKTAADELAGMAGRIDGIKTAMDGMRGKLERLDRMAAQPAGTPPDERVAQLYAKVEALQKRGPVAAGADSAVSTDYDYLRDLYAKLSREVGGLNGRLASVTERVAAMKKVEGAAALVPVPDAVLEAERNMELGELWERFSTLVAELEAVKKAQRDWQRQPVVPVAETGGRQIAAMEKALAGMQEELDNVRKLAEHGDLSVTADVSEAFNAKAKELEQRLLARIEAAQPQPGKAGNAELEVLKQQITVLAGTIRNMQQSKADRLAIEELQSKLDRIGGQYKDLSRLIAEISS